MQEKNLLPISIFVLAISIIIGSSMISKSIEINGQNIGGGISYLSNYIGNNVVYEEEERNNINFQEAAIYLGISESELMLLVNKEEYDIPFIKINGIYIFNKEGLDKWV